MKPFCEGEFGEETRVDARRGSGLRDSVTDDTLLPIVNTGVLLTAVTKHLDLVI